MINISHIQFKIRKDNTSNYIPVKVGIIDYTKRIFTFEIQASVKEEDLNYLNKCYPWIISDTIKILEGFKK